MFASSKLVKLKDIEVMCYDFTYGHLLNIESGEIDDTPINAILDATDFKTADDLKGLRVSELEILYEAILRLSYPQSYDKDGNLKEVKNTEDVDKKKA